MTTNPMTPEQPPKIWRQIGDWFVHADDPNQRHRIESFGADPKTNRVLLRLVCAVRRKEALTTCYADLTKPNTTLPMCGGCR